MYNRIILITGSPGVGKTTLVNRLIERLKTDTSHFPALDLRGFITEEVRNERHERIGFDIGAHSVTLVSKNDGLEDREVFFA